MSTSRRHFLKAAPAAAALAPTLANATPLGGPVPYPTDYYGGAKIASESIDMDAWKASRAKELREMMAGKPNERHFPGHRHAQIAPSIDALRSVSAVNKHRILQERMEALERERMRFEMGWQLFDLIGVRA